MTTLDELTLRPEAGPDNGLYDRFGNRYVFSSHREYQVYRRNQIISWLTRNAPLCFL